MRRHQLVLYTHPGCHLCEEMLEEVRRELGDGAGDVELVDIGRDDILQRRYVLRIPVLTVDGEEVCEGHFNRHAFHAALGQGLPR